MTKTLWLAAVAAVSFTYCPVSMAQEAAPRTKLEVEAEEDDYYYQAPKTYESNTRTIIQQKAMARAEQRNIRLMSLASWGIHSGRPPVAATPLTNSIGPTWQSNPYPFAWLEARRTKYIIIR